MYQYVVGYSITEIQTEQIRQLGELTCKIDIVYVKLGTHDHL